MSDRMAMAQDGATAFYPAVTDRELVNEQELLTNYRRCMGRYRIMWIVTLGLAFSWGVDYVRRAK